MIKQIKAKGKWQYMMHIKVWYPLPFTSIMVIRRSDEPTKFTKQITNMREYFSHFEYKTCSGRVVSITKIITHFDTWSIPIHNKLYWKRSKTVLNPQTFNTKSNISRKECIRFPPDFWENVIVSRLFQSQQMERSLHWTSLGTSTCTKLSPEIALSRTMASRWKENPPFIFHARFNSLLVCAILFPGVPKYVWNMPLVIRFS